MVLWSYIKKRYQMTIIILKSGNKHHFWGRVSITESNGRYVVDDGFKIETFLISSVERILNDNPLTP
jgi:hypothetical protein